MAVTQATISALNPQPSPSISPQFAKMISGARLGLAEEDVLGDPFCKTLSLQEPGALCKDKVAPLPPDSPRENVFDLRLTPQR